jgi:hypothetical protein
MGKLAVIFMLFGLIWIGMEIQTEGIDHAFGGVFSSLEPGEERPVHVSTPDRVGNKVNAAIQDGAARYDDLVEE